MKYLIGRQEDNMTGREFIASQSDEKVGGYMNDLIAHGQLCKQFCEGCKKSRWNRIE